MSIYTPVRARRIRMTPKTSARCGPCDRGEHSARCALIARRSEWEVRVLIGRDLLLEERCARADEAFTDGGTMAAANAPRRLAAGGAGDADARITPPRPAEPAPTTPPRPVMTARLRYARDFTRPSPRFHIRVATTCDAVNRRFAGLLAGLPPSRRSQRATRSVSRLRGDASRRRAGGRVRLDTHVHTLHSGYSTIAPLRRVMRESYNSVEGVYAARKPAAWTSSPSPTTTRSTARSRSPTGPTSSSAAR